VVEPHRILLRAFAIWLPVTVAATIVILAVFVAAQQNLRIGANDPQIQIVEDAAAQLDAGATPASILPPAHVDMARSLAPFVIVFDRQGRPIASSASMNGETPVPPTGVFTSVPAGGRNDVTWQPAAGVREAAVVVAYRDGFVLAGRSLRVVEERESSLGGWVVLAWLGMLGVSGLAALFGAAVTRTPRSGMDRTKSAA
jgi:hypothetical protein